MVREATRKTMRANRGKDTGLELRLRRALWAAGLRGYRKNFPKLPGRPDVVWVGRRLAVFVHGCFWHGCPHCGRYRLPATNREYWRLKVESNQARDARVRSELEALGYTVLVLWECEVGKDPAPAVERIRASYIPTPGRTS